MNLIHDAHAASYGTYGSRRVHAELVLVSTCRSLRVGWSA